MSRLLFEYGILPTHRPEVTDADVVEDDAPDYGDPDPAPLPEAAAREIGVRSIFDREMPTRRNQ